jgi:hypothetical protein
MPRGRRTADPFVRKLVKSLEADDLNVEPQSLHVVRHHGTKECYVCKEKLPKHSGVLAFRLRNPTYKQRHSGQLTFYCCLDRPKCHEVASLKKLNRNPTKRRQDEVDEMKEHVVL